MITAGIISEYNPFHLGHAYHIGKTRLALGAQCAIVCVMSGNFVQRGDFAVFNKHARAKMAILGGADLVIELPSPYALSSAEGFAAAGVHILDSLGICDHISFGSESGDLGALKEAAEAISSGEAEAHLKEWLKNGLPYASALQKAADAVLGRRSEIFRSPNNLLGIEYLKAIDKTGSRLCAMTVQRSSGAHDSDTGMSAAALRRMLLSNDKPWSYMPKTAAAAGVAEIEAGRGPVSIKSCEIAMLSRLREIKDFRKFPGISEGLDRRLLRYAATEPSVARILQKAKTRRYAMSRLRRIVMCACLGITTAYTSGPPPYIRVLAMNNTGRKLLSEARDKAHLPVITKPASVLKLSESAASLFAKESEATDFYVLAYQDAEMRAGGQEWRHAPVIVES